MKFKILSALLAVSLISANFPILPANAMIDSAPKTEIDARADINGPYEKWQIVKVADGDKIIMNVDDEPITVDMNNSEVINWNYAHNSGVATALRDDSTNSNNTKYWQATVTPKHAGKLNIEGRKYIYNSAGGEYIHVMSFKLIVNDSVTLKAGESKRLSAIMNGNITWESNDINIVTVDESGMIEAKAGGKTTVTATDEDKDVVTFTVDVERESDYTVMVGHEKQIPNDGYINWKSADENIVTVDQNGKITGVALGKADVTAIDSEGKEVTFKISVTELQYFNTNIFDYKDGKSATLKKWPPLNADGVMYLDDLDLISSASGWGSIGKGSCGACAEDGNNNVEIGVYSGNAEVVNYEKGIGLHAFNGTEDLAYVKVAVPEGMKYFSAVAGVNQCRGLNSNVKMQFRAIAYDDNDVQVGKTFDVTLGNNDADTSSAIVNLNVEGASYLKLEILDGGNGNGSDHGVFADAKFTINEFDQTTRMKSLGTNDDGIKGINDYTKELNDDDSRNLYFVGGNGDNYDKGAKQNYYTGSNAVVKGIAQNTLDGPYFKSNYTEPGLFTTVANEAKDVFTNVKFPFEMDVDGYYTFDSDRMDASFNDGIGQSGATLNWYGTSADYDGVENADGSHKGFFPFNDTKGAEKYNEAINYWYGMDLAVDFYMMNGGYLDDKKENPIIFEFSGDDDVWVYVDGKLVLDLGGIHSEAGGSINFGTRKINTTDNLGNLVDKNLEEILGSEFWADSSHDENDGENKLHSLEVFYLERGKNASNLKMRFNLPQKDQLTVEKIFDNNNVTDEEKIELYGHDFWFRLTKDHEPFVNADYVVIQNGTIVTENLSTLPDGSFSLKYGQKAVFALETPRQEEHTYQVEEYLREEQNPPNGAGYWDPNKFTTTWETSKNGDATWGAESDEGHKGKSRLAEEILVPAKVTYDRTKVDTYSYAFHNYRNTYLNDDAVVIDYGKKMNIDVFANDELFTKREMAVTYISNGTENGTFSVGKDKETDEQRVTFAPTSYMDKIETASYTVQDVQGNDMSAKVTVIPATTVYYEDDFPGITFNGGWLTEGNSTTDIDIQDDGTVGAGNNYGYDSSYDGDSLYSAGGAHVIDGTGMGTNASFTFTGTGFDIISRTDNKTGKIRVAVTHKVDGKDEQVYAKILDTVYQTEGETLYQIPVIRKTDLPYDEYTVTITVLGNTGTEENQSNTKFYLDAIRVYDPLGKENETANEAYEKDKEKTPYIQEVRNMLIDKGTFDSTADNETGDAGVFGFVYVDGESMVSDVETYKKKGPNNEVYLQFDDGIVTTLYANETPESIQIGAKAPNGAAEMEFVIIPNADSGWNEEDENYDQSHFVYSQKITVNTATDMYYDLKDYFVNEDGESTVEWDNLEWNKGVTLAVHYYFDWNAEVEEYPTSILAITNLKTTGNNVTCKVEPKLVYAVLDELNGVNDTLTINSIDWDNKTVNPTIIVNTTNDITNLKVMEKGKTLKTKKLTSKKEEDGTITWKFTLSGNMKNHEIDIYALDANNNQSEAKQVTFTSKKGGK